MDRDVYNGLFSSLVITVARSCACPAGVETPGAGVRLLVFCLVQAFYCLFMS